jgi:hypothetical protein
MNKKLLAFRISIMAFIATCFAVSFKLETEADCLIMFFTFLFSIGYLGAEVITTHGEAKQ